MNDDIKSILVLCGIASVIGALTGLGLSFTALSPLVIGGIVAAVPGVLNKLCQTAFLVQLNFQSVGKENIKLRHS